MKLLTWLLAFLLGVASTTAVAGAPQIERIEPAHWWAGMKNPRLQLLVHGEGVAALEPAIADARVTLRSVIRTANPNYLFIDLLVAPGAAAGSFRSPFGATAGHCSRANMPSCSARLAPPRGAASGLRTRCIS